MEDRICLDTDFLVNLLRNKEAEREFVLQREGRVAFATTFVNLFELYYGAFKSAEKSVQVSRVLQVEEIQHRFRILNLSKTAVRNAGLILAESQRKGETIDFRDLLIGCIAENEGYCLKTNNVKHFKKIGRLALV